MGNPPVLDSNFFCLDVVASDVAIAITQIDILAPNNARTIRRSLIYEQISIAFAVIHCDVLFTHLSQINIIN